jgi:pyruvate dehydrogenase E2 component (dihydrolipoamide acetyltransferase)
MTRMTRRTMIAALTLAVAAAADAGATVREATVHAFPAADARGRLVPFSPARRIAARRLTESVRNAPHFYLTAHVDMGALREALSASMRAIRRQSGAAPTMTVVLAHLAARTLRAHPLLNASAEGEATRLHDRIDIGVAMDREGDLVVPVLRDAGTRSLAELTAEFRRLRDAVRSRTIAPADLRGATFTLSSLEMHGVDAYTAIIDPPQSAILAVGRTVDTPVGRGGQVVLRPMATLTLSSDHRVVDGVTAARFMADLRRAIEAPDPLA